jgi:hypothetical protein
MDRLWDRLEALPDQRTLKGRRYSLAAIVGISLAAMLSGANDLMAIFRWGRRLTPKGLAASCHLPLYFPVDCGGRSGTGAARLGAARQRRPCGD